MSEQNQRFHAISVPPKWAFTDHFVESNLRKWDLSSGSKICRFRYEKRHHKLAAEEFLMEFFNDETVQSTLQVLGDGREWVPCKPVTGVTCQVAPSDLVSLEFFDRLSTCDPMIVREKGSIVKCMDKYVDGFAIQDMLRDMLLSEESENAELFSEEEKGQLLYRLLYHMVRL